MHAEELAGAFALHSLMFAPLTLFSHTHPISLQHTRTQVFEQWHARKRAERDAKRAAEAEDRKKKVGGVCVFGLCTRVCWRQ